MSAKLLKEKLRATIDAPKIISNLDFFMTPTYLRLGMDRVIGLDIGLCEGIG